MPEALPLRDVIALAPGWWPPAPLWWLIALLALWVMFKGLKWMLSVFRGEYSFLKKAALIELDQLKTQPNLSDQQFCAAVSSLLKRVARRRFQDRNIAHLSAKKWLDFLDETVGVITFSQSGGEALYDAQYRPDAQINRTALMIAARAWVKAV